MEFILIRRKESLNLVEVVMVFVYHNDGLFSDISDVATQRLD